MSGVDHKPIMVDTGEKCIICGRPVLIANNVLKRITWKEDCCSRDCAEKKAQKKKEE